MKHKFGLIGRKLGHSFSRTYFTNKFREDRLNASYSNFELPRIEDVLNLLEATPELLGFNVTVPYKVEIMPLLDSITELAEEIGAVNTVAVSDGKMVGYNTDARGFRDSLAEFYHAPPGGQALILGTGGAARAVAFVLRDYFEFEAITFASRSPKEEDRIGYPELMETGLGHYRLIVNATPLGMHPHVEELPMLPYESPGPENYLYDLIYNPAETAFLKKGRAQKCRVQNGMDMLFRQAEASWEIWNALI